MFIFTFSLSSIFIQDKWQRFIVTINCYDSYFNLLFCTPLPFVLYIFLILTFPLIYQYLCLFFVLCVLSCVCVVCCIDCDRSSHGIDYRTDVLTLFQGLVLRTGHRYVRTGSPWKERVTLYLRMLKVLSTHSFSCIIFILLLYSFSLILVFLYMFYLKFLHFFETKMFSFLWRPIQNIVYNLIVIYLLSVSCYLLCIYVYICLCESVCVCGV